VLARRPLPAVIVAGFVVLATAQIVPAGAGAPPGYVVTDGAEVVEVTVVGGSGGNSPFYPGGAGCRAVVAVPVSTGDTFTWILGGDGGSIAATGTVAAPGAAGGSGARPGGNGGAMTNVFGFNPGTPGAGGGGATGVSLNGQEIIVAAGGGGAIVLTGGGIGCDGETVAGAEGGGSFPTAGGATTPEAGGAGGLGNSGSSTPNPGFDGNSASGSPAGKGGDGAEGTSDGSGGGGGGGGISGGGGGAGARGSFGGGLGSGAAGLSLVPGPVAGIASPFVQGGPNVDSYPTGSSVMVSEVEIAEPSLPEASVGTAFAATLEATFDTTSPDAGPVAVDNPVVWSVSDGTLPPGLNLDGDGALSGSPTEPGTFDVVLAASVLNGVADTRARSVVPVTITVAGGGTSTSTSTITPSTTTPVTPSSIDTDPATTTDGPGGRSGTLPATGASGAGPLVAAGLGLVAAGGAFGLVARRRRTAQL